MVVSLIGGALFGFLANLANYKLLALILERAEKKLPQRVFFYTVKWYVIRFLIFLAVTMGLVYYLGWHFGLGVVAGLTLNKVLLFRQMFRRFLKES